MALINEVHELLHRIRVKLYPNYLPHLAGAYIARTDNEASLSIEEVCAALKNRGVRERGRWKSRPGIPAPAAPPLKVPR